MFGNHWPTHAHDWADFLAQQELQREVVCQVLGEFSDEAQNCTEKAIQRVRREFWTTLERRFAELNARVDVMVKAHREGSIRGGKAPTKSSGRNRGLSPVDLPNPLSRRGLN